MITNKIDNMSIKKVKRFWDWFSSNEEKIAKIKTTNSETYKKLLRIYSEIDNEISFELDFDDKNKKFIISADGLKGKINLVEYIVKNAPSLGLFKIIAFRQPEQDVSKLEINYNGIKVNYDNVYFISKKNNQNNFDLLILFPYFTKSEKETFVNLSFLLLDTILGEYTVMDKINSVEVHSTESEWAVHALPLKLIKDKIKPVI